MMRGQVQINTTNHFTTDSHSISVNTSPTSIVPYKQTPLIYTTVKNKWLVSATTSATTSATLRRLNTGWIVLRSIVNQIRIQINAIHQKKEADHTSPAE